MKHKTVETEFPSIKLGGYVRQNNRLICGVMAAIVMSLTFAGAAQAQTPKDVVAIVDKDSKVQVSWENSDSNVVFYLIRSRSNTGNPEKHYVCRDGIQNIPRWLESKCDPTANFDTNTSRVRYTINSADLDFVQINAARSAGNGFEYSGYSTRANVSEGLPLDLTAERSGNSLTVDWQPNPDTAGEKIKKYVLWIKPKKWSNGRRIGDIGIEPGLPIPLNPNEIDHTLQVKIQAIYETDGIRTATAISDNWIDETGSVVDPLAGDLTDQCRPDLNYNPNHNPNPHKPNVHTLIKADGEYAETRIPLETHVWFFPTEESKGGIDSGESFGHAHLLTCVPHAALGEESVVTDGKLTLDIYIQAHLNSAIKIDGEPLDAVENVHVKVNNIEIRGVNGKGGDILVDTIALNTPMVCRSGESCEHIQRIEVDLANGFTDNGLKQLRIAARHDIHSNATGKKIAQMRSILRHPVELNTSALDVPLEPPRFRIPTITESSGWLIEDKKGAGGYATIGLNKFGLNSERNLVEGMLPIAPISRNDMLVFELRVEADPCVRLCNEDRMPLTNLWGFINPVMHASHGDMNHDDRNSICKDGTNDGCRIYFNELQKGPDGPKDSYYKTVHVNIMHLESGPHTIMFAVEQPMIDVGVHTIDTDFQSTLTGLLLVRFVVTD